MIFGELDIPDPLLDACKRGELLVFAGAGVSMGGTSNLPSFAGLTKLVERNTGQRWKKPEELDRYLGRLAHRGVDVHECIRRIFTRHLSSPNPIHRDLLRLFGCSANVRVVTTNYDQHFTTAARELYDDAVEVHSAPALPVGDNFAGLVYVHGSLAMPAKRMVATDQDFGRAYSSEGWARQFLSDAFQKYTVLFIGYSLNDPPMHYLTRGLKTKHSHYAIVSATESDRWKQLDITPVCYVPQTDGEKHRKLLAGVAGWTEFALMRTLGHRSRIIALLQRSPEALTPEESSYLQHSFGDRQLIRFFYDSGLQAKWLLWAEKSGLLAPAFRELPSEGDTAYAHHVSHWFSRHALTSTAASLAVYVRANQTIPQHLWQHLGQALHARCEEKATQPARTQWCAQLCMHWRPSYRSHFLDYAMMASANNADWPTVLMLLSFLSTPRVVHEKGIRAYADPAAVDATSMRIRLTATDDGHCVEELWREYLKPRLADHAHALIQLSTGTLEDIFKLEAIHSDSDEVFDRVGFGRAAIELHEQDNHRDTFHVLVDIARDAFEHLLVTDRAFAMAVHTRWLANPAPLLKRLAIHGVRIDRAVDADAKLRWLIQCKFLADTALHHEVFVLVREAFPCASPEVQRLCLEHRRETTYDELRQYPDTKAEVFWYSEFCLLKVLDEVSIGLNPPVRRRLRMLQRRFPEFRVSEHPDLTHWSGSASMGDRSPKNAAELAAMDDSELLRYILEFRPDDPLGPNQYGLVGELQRLVSQDSARGFRLAQNVALRGEGATAAIWIAILGGWRDARLDAAAWRQVFTLQADGAVPSGTLHALLGLIRHALETADNLPDEVMTLAENCLFRTLACAPVSERLPHGDWRWYEWAINADAGVICQCLLHTAFRRKARRGSAWVGLPSRYRKAFSRMVAGRTLADQAGRIVLAAGVHFLHAWDSAWVEKTLLPAFDWARDKKCAAQIWQGYLWRGQWTNAYLRRLLPFYEQAYANVGRDGDQREHADRLAHHTAGICLHAKSASARTRLVPAFFRHADTKARVKFVHQITDSLRDATPAQRRTWWNSWIHGYWQDRAIGKPTRLVPEELEVMMAWCPLFEDDFEEAVATLEMCGAGSDACLFFLDEASKSSLVTRHPLATAKLLLLLLRSNGDDLLYGKSALAITERLLAHGETHGLLREISERLAQRGSIAEAERISDALDADQDGQSKATSTLNSEAAAQCCMVRQQRIQMRRTRGWRKPEGTVYVGRPTRWGNPYRVGADGTAAECVARFEQWCRQQQAQSPDAFAGWIAPLRGHDLACWCAPGAPCHADVLLRLASE